MSRKTYVLVSGAWHGGWCWARVGKALERNGHVVIAPDLPGCAPGAGETAAAVTLEQWADSICEILERQPEPAILVGHSRAGIVISRAAERAPQCVQELVYISGFLLREGESVLRVLREEGASPFLRNVALSANRSQWMLTDSGAANEMFYGECSAEDSRWALSQLGVEPAAPMMTPLRITEERFGRVPRRYIECLRDAAVPLALQRKMQSRWPCPYVATLDTDHAPFLSAPDRLVAELLNPGTGHA